MLQAEMLNGGIESLPKKYPFLPDSLQLDCGTKVWFFKRYTKNILVWNPI
ncbi:hypothetical protein ACFL6I_10925 [candidate division KSB1 bacterium]